MLFGVGRLKASNTCEDRRKFLFTAVVSARCIPTLEQGIQQLFIVLMSLLALSISRRVVCCTQRRRPNLSPNPMFVIVCRGPTGCTKFSQNSEFRTFRFIWRYAGYRKSNKMYRNLKAETTNRGRLFWSYFPLRLSPEQKGGKRGFL